MNRVERTHAKGSFFRSTMSLGLGFFVGLGFSQSALADLLCEGFATSSAARRAPERLISFLVQLSEQRTSGALELAERIVKSEGQAQQLGLSSELAAMAYVLERLLDETPHGRQHAIKWFRDFRSRQALTDQDRLKVSEETATAGNRMAFHPLDFSGTFFGHQRTEDIEIMETPVTESMWLKIMGKAPSQFENTKNWLPFEGGKRPIIQFSDKELEKFFKVLNSKANDPEFARRVTLYGHRKGDKYRLPKSHEVSVLHVALVHEYPHLFLSSASQGAAPISIELPNYAWIQENHNRSGRPSPVATRHPFLIQDNPYYDLIGNIDELAIVEGGASQTKYENYGGRMTSPSHQFVAGSARSIYDSFERRFAHVGTSSFATFRIVRERPIKKRR